MRAVPEGRHVGLGLDCLIPLDPITVRQIADSLAEWPFETIYGGWWERVIPSKAKQVMADSVGQYINAVTGSTESF